MAYIIVYKNREAWLAASNTILLTPEEAAAFLAVNQREHTSLNCAIAEVILPPFAEAEKSAA